MIDPDKFFKPPPGMFQPCHPHMVNFNRVLDQTNDLSVGKVILTTTNRGGFTNTVTVMANPDGSVTIPPGMGPDVTVTYAVRTKRETRRQARNPQQRPGQNYLNLRKEKW